MTSPAYAALTCRRPILWGARRLQPGDVVVDLRFRGGRGDLDTFKSLLKWSAFDFVDVAAPAPAPVADDARQAEAQQRITDLEAALAAATTAQRQRIEELEAALTAALAATQADAPTATLDEVPIEPSLALLLKRIEPAQLAALTGLKPAAAKALKAWADDFAVAAPAVEA